MAWRDLVMLLIQLKLMNLFSDVVFWTAIGAIGTLITSATVFFAYKTFKRDKDLSKLRFENAVEISISPNGVYHIINNSDEAIKIYQINQVLIRGTELGIKPDAKNNIILKKISAISEIKYEQKQFLRERWIVPIRSFVFGDSLTHLPVGYEEEAIWIVISEIYYESRSGEKSIYKVSHRFSVTLEPRLMWVEFTNWVVGNTIPV